MVGLVWACDTPAPSSHSNATDSHGNSLPARFQQLADSIKANPNNRDLYLRRAELYRTRAQWPEAMADLERALRIDTLDGQVMATIGLYYMDQALFDEAYNTYKSCAETDPSNVRCLLGQAEIELLLNKYSEAIVLINQALREDQFNARGYWLKGIFYKETGDTTLARSSYATAVEIDPQFSDAYIQLGLLWSDERPDLAEGFYRSAITHAPESTDAVYNLGKLLQDQAKGDTAQWYEAIALYDQLAQMDEKDARPHYNRGYIQLEYFQHYDTAATHFSEAIERYPLYYQAYYNRGLCRESMDDKIGAESDYRQALDIQPNYDPAVYALNRVLGQ